MKIALLDAKTLGNDISLDGFHEFGEVACYEVTRPEETIERLQGMRVAVTNKVVIDRSVIDASPDLKLICVAATGTNNIDLAYAKEKGIVVRNVAGYSTPSVIQHTFALLFSILESSTYYDAFVKNGEWSRNDIFTHNGRPFYELQGKNWGIIGLGEIGRGVARVAESFGCNIAYHSTSGQNHTSDFREMPLDELLSTSQVISIHAPLNERTKDLIGSQELTLLKEGAIIINVGRGGIIHEKALAESLDKRNIFAALDVTEKEPIPADSLLLSLRNPDRIVMTPHIAWASRESRERLVEAILNNIREFMGKDANSHFV